MAERSLTTYKAKRDFAETPEPKDRGKSRGGLFVVQHHWATREHYDFRLELDGVLLSWAVTRGPSFDPADKRLAVRTEDHPLSYGGFEGLIPQGNYGAGTVLLWDSGTWKPLDSDPRQALAKGALKFTLNGKRLEGRWALIRMRTEGKRENWLLIKERDEYAAKGVSLEDFAESILSGKTREEIENNRPATRRRTARKSPPKTWNPPTKRAASKTAARPASTAGRASQRLPPFIPPMLCELHDEPPPGAGWLHETKYDGYRIEAAVDGARVRLYTREGLDWTKRFPAIAEAFARLNLRRTLIDGEAVVFDRQGLSDFAALVKALKEDTQSINFAAFDILVSNGKDIRHKPLTFRKEELADVLKNADSKILRISSFIEADGRRVFDKAVEMGAEGIVSKRAASLYESHRSGNWIKIKTARREDFIIVGYKPSERRQFSSLLAAAETPYGLEFVGGVGTGFNNDELADILERLRPLRLKTRPSMKAIERAPRKAVWVEPVLRAEVKFHGWTADGQLRHARFLGWREDRKTAKGKNMARKTPSQTGKPVRSAGTTAPRRSAKLGAVPASITHPDRAVFPDVGLTKGDIASYYAAVADRMMPHLDGRPISFVRAPDGLAGQKFFQRHQLAGMSAGIKLVPDPDREHEDFVAIASPEGLLTAAQFGVIEIHGWGARLPKLHNPDRIVLDLDPDPAVPFTSVREAAFELRDLLAGIELESFAMITGGKGIHLVVPLDASQEWDVITDFADGIAQGLASADPDRYIATASKEKRKNRIYVDWLRNRLTASAIMPWSLRAKPNASVAVPVTWPELRKFDRADEFTLLTAPDRKDPWTTKFFTVKQRIDEKVLAFLKAGGGTAAGKGKKRTGKA
jgi:bifunctional non-homologous end joining protein LigD